MCIHIPQVIITIITTYYHYHYHDALNLPSVLSSPIAQFLSTGLSPCALKNAHQQSAFMERER